MERRTDLIKRLLLEEIAVDSISPVAKVASLTNVSRQAADKQLRNLIAQGVVLVEGEGKASRYSLPVLAEQRKHFSLPQGLEEHVVWREVILPALVGLSHNDLAKLAFGFNEIRNNAIEHSHGKEVMVRVVRNASTVTLQIVDDGLGVFRKVADSFRFSSLAQALFEVSKGKLTTEPARHNGEGIFFAARMFDAFMLTANGIRFLHNANIANGWLAELDVQNTMGTVVSLVLTVPSAQTMQQVFDQYVATKGDFGFTKTDVLLKFAQLEEKLLMSRSHARRVGLRFERFREVVLDFDEIETIGPAFLDEMLRVIPAKKPNTKISMRNVSDSLQGLIARANTK